MEWSRVCVSEVAGGPAGGVELDDLPGARAGLPRQGRDEAVDGGRVLDVPEKLSAAPAGEIAPLDGGVGVYGSDAPPPLGRANRGAVPSGERSQPPVGDGETAAALDGGDQREVQDRKPPDDLGEPRPLQPHKRAQVGVGEPRPIGEQVEGALLDGFEHRGQHPILPGLSVEVSGQGRPCRRLLVGPGASRPGVVEDGAKVEERGPGRGAPEDAPAPAEAASPSRAR